MSLTRSELLVIGLSAGTAAVVALATVLAVQGRGAARPTPAPAPIVVSAAPAIAASADTPTLGQVAALEDRVRQLQADLDRVQGQLVASAAAQVAASGSSTQPAPIVPTGARTPTVNAVGKSSPLDAGVAAPVTAGGPCDAGELSQRGKDEIHTGQYDAAVVSLAASLACQPDPALYRLILLAACNANNAVVAQTYFAKLPTAQQAAASQMCIRNRISLAPAAVDDPPDDTGLAAPANCDASQLAQKGKDRITDHQYATALIMFEASFRCRPDPRLIPLIMLAACDSNDISTAKKYFSKLKPADQAAAAEGCFRNNISLP